MKNHATLPVYRRMTDLLLSLLRYTNMKMNSRDVTCNCAAGWLYGMCAQSVMLLMSINCNLYVQ